MKLLRISLIIILNALMICQSKRKLATHWGKKLFLFNQKDGQPRMASGPYPALVPNRGTITHLIWLMFQILMTNLSDQLSIRLMKSLCLKIMFISFNWLKALCFMCLIPVHVLLHCLYFCNHSFTSPWIMLSVLTTLRTAYCVVSCRVVSCRAMPCRVVPCCVVSYRIVSIVSYRKFKSIQCEFTLRLVTQNIFYDKWAPIELTAWCCQATVAPDFIWRGCNFCSSVRLARQRKVTHL